LIQHICWIVFFTNPGAAELLSNSEEVLNAGDICIFEKMQMRANEFKFALAAP